MLSGCGTYTGAGAYAGASLGGLFGSAVGGISGGPRGSDVGTLVGMVGGAAVGAAIGAAADEKEEARIAAARQRAASRTSVSTVSEADDVYESDYVDNAYDGTVSGDDRIDLDLEAPATTVTSAYTDERLTIRNVEFIDQNGDGRLNPGETATIAFEIMNYTPYIIYDVMPDVTEVNGNRNILISQGVRIESLAPGNGVRYTAMVKGGKGLRTGRARFRLSVATVSGEAQPYAQELLVNTFR